MEWNGNTLPMLVSGAAIAFTGVVRWAVGSNMKQLDTRLVKIERTLTKIDERVYDLHEKIWDPTGRK